MVKKLNHKIFNLIIMICIGICVISISSISYAQETKVIYGQDVEMDYEPDKRDDENLEESTSDDTLWLKKNNSDLFQEVRKNVAQWYIVFRYIAVAVMLVILLVLAIKLAISSIAEQKAIYKRMLLDWVACFVLLFMSHYFMIFVQFLNERIIAIFQNVSNNLQGNGEYGLYETVRSRAYDIKFTVGFTGMVLYMMLVWFTGKYVLIYAKRFILMVILTIMAPIIVLFYAVQKIFTGKSNTLSKWMGEYFTNTIMQALHAMTYAVFVGLALKLSETSLVGIILSFICLNFMSSADKMFREIFKFFDGSSTAEEIAQSNLSDLKDDAMTAVGVAAAASQIRKNSKNTIGYHNALWRDTLSKLKVGKKFFDVKDAIRDFPGNAALLAAGGLTRGFNQRGYAKRTLKREQKNSEFNKKIDKYDEAISKLKENLEKNKMSAEQKEQLEQRLQMLQKERAGVVHKQGNYNTRAGVYERLRVLLDPDTYLDYVVDEDTGDFKTKEVTRKKKVNGKNVKQKEIIKKRRMVRKKIAYNALTNSYEVHGGFKERLEEAKAAVFNLSDDDKKVLSELTQVVKDGTIGAGAMMLGVGSFADNPTLGFALLATGAGKTKNFLKVNDNGLKISRFKRRRIARYYLNQTEKTRYKDAEFSSGAILNMDKSIRELTNLDPSPKKMNRISAKLASGKLKYSIPTLVFTLTGTKGGIQNAIIKATAVAEQHKKNIKAYEISVNVEYAKAITKEILEECEIICQNITTYMMNESVQRIFTDSQLRNGSMFVVNGKGFGFKNRFTNANLTREDKIRQAIMQIALRRNIYNFNRFDLNNKYILNDLLNQLKADSVIEDKDFSTDALKKMLLNGTNKLTGINAILADMSTKTPDLLKTKLFQSCVEDYAKLTGSKGVDDLLSKAAQKSIMLAFKNKYYHNNTGAQIQSEILELAASGNKKISELSTEDIIKELRVSNPSAVVTLEESIKAKANGSSLEKEIEIQQKQIDSTLSDMVVGVLVKNNITNPALIDFSIINDETINLIKSQLLEIFGFAFKDAEGFNVSEETILELMENKIASLSKEDIEKAAVNEVCSKFISEKCEGDVSKLDDPEVRAELEQLTAEKLQNMAETQDEKDNYENVIELLKGKTNSEASSGDSDNDDIFSFGNESPANDPDVVGDYPLPLVTAKCVGNKVICTFELPGGLDSDEYKIEACKKTKSSSNEVYVEGMEKIILSDIDEIACARLVRNNKHGQALVVKYPADAIKVAESVSNEVEKTKEDESKRRARAGTKNMDSIALNVFDSLKESAQDKGYIDLVDKTLEEDQLEKLEETETELYLKECEIRSATNKVLDVADMIRGKKVRMNNDDDKPDVISMLDDAFNKLDNIIGMDFAANDEEIEDSTEPEEHKEFLKYKSFSAYNQSVDTLVNKLLQMKMLDDDNEKLGIKKIPEKNKAFKKTKRSLQEGIKEMDIEEIIEQWKGAN